MSDQKVKKIVVVHKRTNKSRERIGVTYEELKTIRKWILTGSFSNSISSDVNVVEDNDMYLLKKAASQEPEKLNKLMLECSLVATKKDALIIALIMLSSGTFHSKKCFKESFNKIIKSPNDLYRFLHLCKKHRGFGSVIHNAIKKWIINKDVKTLETMFVEEKSKFNWSMKDVLRLIKPKPRNKNENLLFKWIINGTVSDNERIDYANKLPLVSFYEEMKRYNPDNSVEKYDTIDNYPSVKRLTSRMIPGNCLSDFVFSSALENKNKEDLFRYLATHRSNEEVVTANLYAFIKAREDNVNYNIDVVEMLAIKNSLYLRTTQDIELIQEIEKVIDSKIIDNLASDGKSISIIDMSHRMFEKSNYILDLTAAEIAHMASIKSGKVFNFSGHEIRRTIPRNVINAEGAQEDRAKININKIKENINNPKMIYVWTNRKGIALTEKDVEHIKKCFPSSKVCLINMNKSDVHKKNGNYYVINGFTKITKKILKLIERDV